jgi:hypothetical protein
VRPVFIGGTGRCGTTILRKALGQHPKIAALPGELRIIVDSDGALDLFSNLTSSWSPYRADHALWRFKDLLQQVKSGDTSRYTGHTLDEWVGADELEEIEKKFFNALISYKTRGFWTGSMEGRDTIYETSPWDKEDLRDVFSWFFDALYRQVGKNTNVWVDDTPDNLQHPYRLVDTFPQSVIVHIYRNPFDVLASYNRIRTRSRRWTSGSTSANASRIRNMLDAGMEKLESSCCDVVYKNIKFEDFVSSPQETLTPLLDFLGLDWHDSITCPIDRDRAHVGRQHFEEQGLSKNDITVAKRILNPVAERLGYETL